jgi:hypothetical protein
MKEIPILLEKIYNNLELRKKIVPLFLGNPGLGKTQMIYQFANKVRANVVEFITSQRNPFEISGLAMPDKDVKRMSFWDFDTLLEMKDGDILFFDEILNGNPNTLNACLTLLEQRKMISGKSLPNIMIIAAANPQGMAPLTPQIKERFVWYDVAFDEPMWVDYMINKYYISKSIGSKLSNLIRSEDFTGYNYMTPRSIDKNLQMILDGIYTPYEKTILPILQELIKNPFNERVLLSESTSDTIVEKWLEPDQMISWLDIYKIKFKKNEITRKQKVKTT